MLTRVEIDGFRSFLDFAVDLGPLHVVAGPNASGKSNFFDALHLLSRLVTHDSLRDAFGDDIRGEPLRQFTSLGRGASASEMRFAVEAIAPQKIRDPWGEEAPLSRTHLRYELTLTLTGKAAPRLIRIAHEKLTSYGKTESQARLGFERDGAFDKAFLAWGRRATSFIDTEGDKVVLHQDGHAGRKREHKRQDLQGTVLSAVNSATFRHAYAMREVLSGLRFLQLEPVVLREPSPLTVFADDQSRTLGGHGEHLPAVLARLEAEDPRSLARITKDLSSVVSEARRVRVERDDVQKVWIAQVEMAHGDRFPASLLSDGTLRILALAALRNDTQHTGVLCFEEPENGIHPLKLRGLFEVLRGLASRTRDGSAGRDTGPRLRQLLVNTHSPGLVSIVPQATLLLASLKRVLARDASVPAMASVFLPVRDGPISIRKHGSAPTSVTRAEVERLLASVETPDWLQEPAGVA